MRNQSLKSYLVFFVLFSIVWFFLISRLPQNAPEEETASTTEQTTTTSQIEETTVVLEVIADNDGDTVNLGNQIEYTINIKNGSTETINVDLTNTLSSDLLLEENSIEINNQANDEVENQVNNQKDETGETIVSWSGKVASGQIVAINYTAHPNFFSDPGLILDNAVSLMYGTNTLQNNIEIVTYRSMWNTFIVFIASLLQVIGGFLATANIPYAFGFGIILFTVIIKALTFPLNNKQFESAKATQELQPKLKALQKKYGKDKEKLAQAQMELYKEAGINPLGGCLPMLVQMPIWFALYRALFQLTLAPEAREALQEGFFWIPDLSGPVTDLNALGAGGIGWVNPMGDTFIGWGPAIAYLILPVLLVVLQYYMQQMMTPKSSDPTQQSMAKAMSFMPLMFGYFALVVPAGLTLYWFTNTLLSLAQQKYMYRDKDKNDANQKKLTKQTNGFDSPDSPDSSDSSDSFNKISPMPQSVVNQNGATVKNNQVKTNGKRKSRSKRKRKK